MSSQFEPGACDPCYATGLTTLTAKLLGHEIPVTHQSFPGKETDMPRPKPQFEDIPNEDAGYQKYRAAGKLKGRRAIITGGDSGIGRAAAILFAMEGADTLIAYLPEEEEDAQDTKKRVEKYGKTCHLMSIDLTTRENCKKVVDEALAKLGGIDILFNNHAYQMMVESINDLPEYVSAKF